MAEKYGIKTHLLKGAAEAPVSISTCLVFVGSASKSDAHKGNPVKIDSYKKYLDTYHSGKEPEGELSLDICAKYALSRVNSAWFINCGGLADGASKEALDADKQKVLAGALDEICRTTSDIPNLICVPGTQDPDLLAEVARLCEGNIGGKYFAQASVDCKQASEQLVNVDGANGYDLSAAAVTVPNPSGFFLSSIGWINGTYSSVVVAVARALQDAKNVNGIPYRSVGNLRLAIEHFLVWESDILGRKANMDELAENGIIAFVNKGNNKWYTWGDHTSAVNAGAVDDETFRFDSTIAVLCHLLNRFAKKWSHVIDSPMTLRLRDCIIAEEQDYLNSLKALGCIVGTPKCEFRPSDNSADTLGQGQFYFTNIATIVPPAKYIDLGIQYTSEGLKAFIEE